MVNRVVPKESVTTAADREWDADLGVLLVQRDDRAFLIEQAVLVLAEAVEALALVRLEGRLEAPRIARRRAKVSRRRPREVAARLGEQLLAGLGVQEADLQLVLRLSVRMNDAHLDPQPAIGQRGEAFADVDALSALAGREQSRQRVVA